MKRKQSIIGRWYTVKQNKRVSFIARFDEVKKLVDSFYGNYHTTDNINAAIAAGRVSSSDYISDIVTKKEIAATIQAITNRLLEKYENGQNILEPDYSLERQVIKVLDNAIVIRENIGRAFSIDEVKEIYGLHFTLSHKGKMAGEVSLSTTCKANDFCRARIEMAKNADAENMIICGGCFADEQTDNYGKDFLKPFLYNLYLLNRFIIPIDILPYINYREFRIESFGDLQSEVQQINYFNFMNVNRKTTFAQWTKNPGFIGRVLDKLYARPVNVRFIYSELYLNSTRTLSDVQKKWPFFNAIFRVFTAGYLKLHPEIKINCGAAHCLTCKNSCYNEDTTITEINEEYNTPGSKNKRRAERLKKGEM